MTQDARLTVLGANRLGTDVLTIEKKYASYQSGELSELMIKYSSLNQLTP